MLWKVSSAVDLRLAFILAVQDGERSKAALCRAFGISRECGYKWLKRFVEDGVDGLNDVSRAPLKTPHALAQAAGRGTSAGDRSAAAERCLERRLQGPLSHC